MISVEPSLPWRKQTSSGRPSRVSARAATFVADIGLLLLGTFVSGYSFFAGVTSFTLGFAIVAIGYAMSTHARRITPTVHSAISASFG